MPEHLETLIDEMVVAIAPNVTSHKDHFVLSQLLYSLVRQAILHGKALAKSELTAEITRQVKLAQSLEARFFIDAIREASMRPNDVDQL